MEKLYEVKKHKVYRYCIFPFLNIISADYLPKSKIHKIIKTRIEEITSRGNAYWTYEEVKKLSLYVPVKTCVEDYHSANEVKTKIE